MMRWAGHIARMGQMKNTYTILVGKPEGTRQTERDKCRWEVSGSQEQRMEWIHLAKDRVQWLDLVNMTVNSLVL